MRTKPRRLNCLTLAKLIRAIQDCPSSAQDVADASGLFIGTARDFCRSLHKEKAVRIVAWEPDSLGRAVTPVYAFGSGPDAKKPPPRRDQKDWKRRYRARIKAAKQQAQILEALHQ
jgi:hypothetical protein